MEACHEYDISPGIILKDPLKVFLIFTLKKRVRHKRYN